MKSRKDKAVELFKEGFNCSQAVFAAYSDLYGMDKETALKIASSFGAGMGRMREVCGTCSGMFLVAGLESGATEGKDTAGKKQNYDMVQMLAEEFRKRNGTIICRELLGLDQPQVTAAEFKDTAPQERTAQYYEKRPCVKLVEEAAQILESTILKERFTD
ncbi:C-GCAxxG-C-C family protein [[Clostridium] polysaccharolyticum]|jgi:C_GCAxxG_C_C family probable redox protein|uniref:C_GCAxxG_C_C family probable redox protein n=1 Tax=[Clostridium] polysaccharolyticum TaxID=29364 RepID=A0A1I0C8R7_9FIRM|nr:C-GCAxxG-C-C family protein [[Clostridium] polysaccharolyticum]SET15221.1 C_GCAxxG_C_C family probable redox protein [[Clostridium] polysaccharolyticum]